MSSMNSWPDPESSLRRGRGSLKRDQLRDLLRNKVHQPLDPASLRQQKGFPEEAEMEFERSVIRIPFYLNQRDRTIARDVDVMVFDAYMRILREAPIRNGLGFRQFEFYIDAWELTNTYSQGLNANITFTLSATEQPKSICIAHQRDSDYPAMIIYNAIYDVYFNHEKIIENQPGTAYATPVTSIPPRNVTVAFEKPFTSDLFEFSAGSCEGMASITREQFEQGAYAARKIRGQE